MKQLVPILVLAASLHLGAQSPDAKASDAKAPAQPAAKATDAPAAPAAPAAKAAPAASAQPAKAAEPEITVPTRAKPQEVSGKISMGASAPVYAGPGRKHNDGIDQRSFQSMLLNVAPHSKLKAQLKGSPRGLKVFFVSEDMNRTLDPGLAVNRIMGRDDAAFYENKTDKVRNIYCVVQATEQMTDNPFTLVFTDF
jgi:hypothetical protein